jgi:beta-glucanase (GH16 family)
MLCICVLGALGASTPLIADATSTPARPLSGSAAHAAHVRAHAHAASGSAHRHRRARSASTGNLIWSDEFNGPAGTSPDPTKWSLQTGGGGWGNNELEDYTARSSNVALDGQGQLAITARRENYTSGGITREYTSARLQTKGLFATEFGRIEARIKLPAGPGLWPAFWALGGDIDNVGWPNSGEIDVMESLGSDPFTLFGSIHGPEPGSPKGYHQTAPEHSATSLASRFHVFGVEWSPAAITFTFDGVPYSTRTPASLSAGQQWVFNKPFFLLLNLAVGGEWPGAPRASTPFPATMLVDWVRVYSQ